MMFNKLCKLCINYSNNYYTFYSDKWTLLLYLFKFSRELKKNLLFERKMHLPVKFYVIQNFFHSQGRTDSDHSGHFHQSDSRMYDFWDSRESGPRIG